LADCEDSKFPEFQKAFNRNKGRKIEKNLPISELLFFPLQKSLKVLSEEPDKSSASLGGASQ
jgi:hypothetical protein